ncbi:unnamed protein product [Closterium sp. Yama58-4]|nr:unnamed protein product [Closterium sp. Yama58-4]
MADISQFDEVMELNDEDLKAMDLPDDPAGSNLPRTLMEGPAGTPEKPASQPTSTNASDAAASASAPSAAAPFHPAPVIPGPSSSTPIGHDVSAETNATVTSLVETPPEPELPRSSRQPVPAPPMLPPPVLMTSSRFVVTLLFPGAGADAIRATLIANILSKLKPSLFACGYVPDARPTNGETMRLAGRSYATICVSWPTQQSADEFLAIFNHPIGLSPGRSISVKPYTDPFPEFTKAKAEGAPVLSLRRVPARFEEANLLAYLVPAWLAGIESFHRMKDPYEGVFLPIFTGIPTPLPTDPDFRTIPARIRVGGPDPDILVNISTHVCSICVSNHRVEDHAIFPCKRNGRIGNKSQLTVAQLQKANGGLLGARPASNAFRADPGLLFICTDLDVEPWTYVACNFECGPALDSALLHMESAEHRAQLLANTSNKAPKEPFLSWSYEAFLKNGGFEAFLKQLKSTSRA